MDVHDCHQLCVNTDGGFSCECNSGFQFNTDQRTCSGMSLTQLSETRIIINFVVSYPLRH